MKEPKPLRPGESILAIAPSFGVTTEPYATRYFAAKERFLRRGYRVEEGPCVFLNEGVAASASPEMRAKEILDGYRSEAALLLSVGGGETMCDVLPHLDFEALSALPPKWFMGFSDNTNLCFPLATLSGVVSIYGPCFPSFHGKKWRLAEEDAWRMLGGETHFEGYPKYSISRSDPAHPLWAPRMTQAKRIVEARPGEAQEGTILGGCLDCLLTLCGTKFDRVKAFQAEHPEGVLWFLEACDLSPLGIRRGLFQLKEAGWFENAKGFYLGRALCRDLETFGLNAHQAAIDVLAPLGKPLYLDVDLGHLAPSMPLKIGARARVEIRDGNLLIDYKAAETRYT